MSLTDLKVNSLKQIDILDENSPVNPKPTPFRLHYVSEDRLAKSIFITDSVARRIKAAGEAQRFDRKFTLYVNDKGVVEDYDSEPRNPRLPLDMSEGGSSDPMVPTQFVVLEKSRTDNLTVKINNGVSAELVNTIKAAAAKHIQEHGAIKAFDILDGMFFVMDTRNDNRYIYIKPEAI